MAPRLDLTGRKFGKLLVSDQYTRSEQGRYYWTCRCDCGKETIARASDLTTGNTTSCGCVKFTHKTTHGLRDSPEYVVWNNMLQRCGNSSNPMFHYYGERGIEVCPQWQSFGTFIADMGPRPSPDHSIERRDVNGNYEPDNCYWATPDVQANNRRNNVVVEFEGQSYTLAQLAAKTGVGYQTLRQRIFKQGLSVVDAVIKERWKRV